MVQAEALEGCSGVSAAGAGRPSAEGGFAALGGGTGCGAGGDAVAVEGAAEVGAGADAAVAAAADGGGGGGGDGDAADDAGGDCGGTDPPSACPRFGQTPSTDF